MKLEEFGLTCEVEVITPEMAEAYLANNFKHRDIKESKVDKYVETLKNGEWRFNGKVITFNKDGVLMNGQHRLSAVVKSGIPIKTLVVRGIDTP